MSDVSMDVRRFASLARERRPDGAPVDTFLKAFGFKMRAAKPDGLVHASDELDGTWY